MYPPPDPWPADELRIGTIEVRALYFVGKRIPVNGYSYINCRFDNCEFEEGLINMTNCKINAAAAIRASSGKGGA